MRIKDVNIYQKLAGIQNTNAIRHENIIYFLYIFLTNFIKFLWLNSNSDIAMLIMFGFHLYPIQSKFLNLSMNSNFKSEVTFYNIFTSFGPLTIPFSYQM